MTVKDMGQPVSASIVWQQQRGERSLGAKQSEDKLIGSKQSEAMSSRSTANSRRRN